MKLSGIVFLAAVVFAISATIVFVLQLFKRLSEGSRRGWSSNYDVNLHFLIAPRAGEATPLPFLAIGAVLLLLLGGLLQRFGL
jgi:hypothetical protein